jgi:pyruvate dehydrogenase E2 component (dihydrolipoamide acetyltransferase)
MYGTLAVDVGPLQKYLKQLSEKSGVRCTLTHAVSRSLAILLRRYPECNILVRRRRIWVREDVDIFHQVAILSEGKGADLSGATIRQVDTKSLQSIARELAAAAQKVREQKDMEMVKTRSFMMSIPNFLLKWILKFSLWISYSLNIKMPATPRDTFGSAMITNVGMFGIRHGFAPIFPLSQVPILVMVGQIEDRPVVRDGKIVIRSMCTLTASMDHRALDGYQAGCLARDLQQLLENPELLDLPD